MRAMPELSARIRKSGLLYPMLVIAAIAVTAFSAVGIATMMGWMPSAMSERNPAVAPDNGMMQGPGGAVTQPSVPQAAPPPRALPEVPPARAQAPAVAPCNQCGVIESIRTVEVPGESSWVGAGGGAAVGALVGSQVGSGRGKMVASGVGAAGGSYAGIQLEKHLKRSVKYQVRVRMEDGKMRTFTRTNKPAFDVGQRVRVTDRALFAEGAPGAAESESRPAQSHSALSGR